MNKILAIAFICLIWICILALGIILVYIGTPTILIIILGFILGAAGTAITQTLWRRYKYKKLLNI